MDSKKKKGLNALMFIYATLFISSTLFDNRTKPLNNLFLLTCLPAGLLLWAYSILSMNSLANQQANPFTKSVFKNSVKC